MVLRSKPYDPPKSWNRISSCFSWRKAWTGVKCNFFSAHHHVQNVIGNLSISPVRMCNFTRVGCKTKKLWLSIIPALRRSYHPRLGEPQKGVNRNFSWPHLDKSYVVRKLSISEAWICRCSMIGQKIKITALLIFFAWKLRKISLDWALWCTSRGIDNFSLLQLNQLLLPWIALD